LQIDTTKSASKAKSSDASVKVESAKTEANADAENSIYGGIQLKSASVIKQALPKESTTNAVNPYAAVSLKPILTGTETVHAPFQCHNLGVLTETGIRAHLARHQKQLNLPLRTRKPSPLM